MTPAPAGAVSHVTDGLLVSWGLAWMPKVPRPARVSVLETVPPTGRLTVTESGVTLCSVGGFTVRFTVKVAAGVAAAMAALSWPPKARLACGLDIVTTQVSGDPGAVAASAVVLKVTVTDAPELLTLKFSGLAVHH